MGQKAKESSLVRKAREKLKKQLQYEHKQMTSEALGEMSKRIRSSIARHHPEASYLKKRKFTLFDENLHSAETKSHHIRKMINLLHGSQVL